MKKGKNCYQYIDGRKGTRLYTIYKNIKQRCFNPKNPSYKRYGQLGITLCEEWKDFSVFKKWSEENGYLATLTIDRIINELGYSPDNCRWITYQQQNINRRIRKTNKSGYKGVHKQGNKWQMQIQINSKLPKIQHSFKELIDAAFAYNELSKKYHGEYSQTNKLPSAWTPSLELILEINKLISDFEQLNNS